MSRPKKVFSVLLLVSAAAVRGQDDDRLPAGFLAATHYAMLTFPSTLETLDVNLDVFPTCSSRPSTLRRPSPSGSAYRTEPSVRPFLRAGASTRPTRPSGTSTRG